MERFATILTALLFAIAAMIASSCVGMFFLMIFDTNYHSGYWLIGGLVIGTITGVIVFRAVIRRANLSLDNK